MRNRLFLIFLLCCLCVQQAAAFKRKPYKGLPRTEAELLTAIVTCMQYKDTISYPTIFYEFDTLWKQMGEYKVVDEMEQAKLQQIKQHPERIRRFDPVYNSQIIKDFYAVLKKGEDSGIHWNQIMVNKYEFQKVPLTRDLVGYEMFATERFQGYVYLKDLLSQQDFIFTVTEMQHIGAFWYGGELLNILPASSIEEYKAKHAGEIKRQRMLRELGLTEEDLVRMKSGDSGGHHIIAVKENDEDDMASTTKSGLRSNDIVDRKYYTGKFDNEIPVKLYVRYIKGNCPGHICGWDAIYKFGDQDEFIKLDVTRTKDGKWLFNEDPPIGTMELILTDKIYTGTWASSDIKTGYEVKLKEVELSSSMTKQLDNIIEKGLWSRGLKEDKEKDPNEKMLPISEDMSKGVY